MPDPARRFRHAASTLALACALFAGSHACRGRSEASSVVPGDARSRTHRERVGELNLNVVEVGPNDAPMVLVVHGGPGLDHSYLRPWLDALAPRSRVVYVDLRGHGHSDLPPDSNGYTIRAAATDLALLIRALGHGLPCDVIAHDFGAPIAVELAISHGEVVRRLILVAPYSGPDQIRGMPVRTRATLGESGYQRIGALSTPQGTLRDPHAVVELFRRLGRMWFHRVPDDAVFRRLGRDVVYRAAADEHFLIDGAGWSAAERAPEVRTTTLVISGDDDRTFTLDESRALADLLPHGRIAVIHDAGHLPFVEQPARFISEVDGFLRGPRRSQ